MYLTITFVISGLCASLLLVVKRLEEKRKRSFALLDLVSRGDHKVRELAHSAAHIYDELKAKGWFMLQKQLPLRARSLWNKAVARAKITIDKYTEQIRGSKLLRRSDGISEFFQSLSSVEKGEGEITEVNFDHYQEPVDDVE